MVHMSKQILHDVYESGVSTVIIALIPVIAHFNANFWYEKAAVGFGATSQNYCLCVIST